MSISSHERLFIKEGVEFDVRNDGRKRMDFRDFTIKTGVIPNANGSSQVELEGTKVLVGVKVEIETPSQADPLRGRLECSAQCTSNATLESGNAQQDFNARLTGELERFLTVSSCIDLSALCVVPGKRVWVVFVDVMIIGHGGNLLDAMAIAVKAAMLTADMPKLTVTKGEKPGEFEMQVHDDPFDAVPLPIKSIDDFPILVSLTKIGKCFVVDATREEELCMAASITVAVNSHGQLCGVNKSSAGGIAPETLRVMLACARQAGMELNEKLRRTLQSDEMELVEE